MLVYLVVLVHKTPQLWTHLRLTQCGQTVYLDYWVAQVAKKDKTSPDQTRPDKLLSPSR